MRCLVTATSLLCIMILARGRTFSKPGCPETCGTVSIPYPFGIGSSCSANSNFTVVCVNSSFPRLSSCNLEIASIALSGTMQVKNPVTALTCSGQEKTQSLLQSLHGTPFRVSPSFNRMLVLGCKNAGAFITREDSVLASCVAICGNDSRSGFPCNGVNCCVSLIPWPVKEISFRYTAKSTVSQENNGSCGHASSGKSTVSLENNRSCGYAFLTDVEQWFRKDYHQHIGL